MKSGKEEGGGDASIDMWSKAKDRHGVGMQGSSITSRGCALPAAAFNSLPV
jgi:hypothetical protein